MKKRTLLLATLVVAGGLTVQTSSLGPGAVGVNYSQTLVGSGGKVPFVWAVSQGSLPAGLKLDPATGIAPISSVTISRTTRSTVSLGTQQTGFLLIISL